MDEKIEIRTACKEDSDNILKLILELAEFEKLPPPDKPGQERLIKDAFSENPPFYILVAENSSKKLVGYAFYFFTYSTFRAKKSLYLEDLFISEDYRNKSIGKLFFQKLLNAAEENKCGRLEWVVLDWNINAIKFYEKLGAVELKEWKVFRLSLD